MAKLSEDSIPAVTDPTFLLNSFNDESLPTLVRLLRTNAQETPGAIALKQKARGIWQPVTWVL